MNDPTDYTPRHPDPDEVSEGGAPTPPSTPPDLAAPAVSTATAAERESATEPEADPDAPSALARRAGPIVAGLSLLATVGMVAWMGLGPTAIAGPLTGESFLVPATLATAVSESGCLDLVDGRGGSQTLCVDGAQRYAEVFFDDEGRLLVGGDDALMVVDQATGEVLERVAYEDVYERVPEPPRPPGEMDYLDVHGSEVRDPMTDELLLDLQGPPGYRLQQAVRSPDGEWLVMVAPGEQVVVAPADGSAAPRVWTDMDTNSYVDINRAILWSSADEG